MAPVRSIHLHQSTPTQPFTSSQPYTSSQDSSQDPSTSAQPTTTTQLSTSTQPSSSQSMQASPADNNLSAMQQSSRRATEKPIASLAYNKSKIGIDKSDQMASYALSLRKGLRCYIELTVEILLAVVVANACMLCGKASQKTIKIRSFKEELADSLLKVSSNNSYHLRSPSMRLSATHNLITRVNAARKPRRRYCNSCYKNFKDEKVREMARKTVKHTNIYCDRCTG